MHNTTTQAAKLIAKNYYLPKLGSIVCPLLGFNYLKVERALLITSEFITNQNQRYWVFSRLSLRLFFHIFSHTLGKLSISTKKKGLKWREESEWPQFQ